MAPSPSNKEQCTLSTKLKLNSFSHCCARIMLFSFTALFSTPILCAATKAHNRLHLLNKEFEHGLLSKRQLCRRASFCAPLFTVSQQTCPPSSILKYV